MKLRNTLSILVITLLLCGNAFSKPGNDDAPPTVDVNVVNTPDVNVVNTPDVNVVNNILLENTLLNGSIGSGGAGQGGGGSVSLPGYLHGFNFSLGAESGDKCIATATIEIEDKSTGTILRKIILSSLVAIGGSTSIAHDFTTPIEIFFDPATETALKFTRYSDFTDATNPCVSALTLIYETF